MTQRPQGGAKSGACGSRVQTPFRLPWLPPSGRLVSPSLMPDSKAAWYVIHSHPKCEHLAASMMLELPDVETYCPRIRFQRNTRRGKIWFVEALFPSYFFARFDPANSLRAVKYSKNVIRIVDFGNQLIPVPDHVIASIREEMEGLDVREISVGVKVGDTVELTEGPMRG